MVEYAQLKIAKICEKQRQKAKISTSYRKLLSLNSFPVRRWQMEAQSMYVMRMRRYYRYKIHSKSIARQKLPRFYRKNWCAEFKYAVRF